MSEAQRLDPTTLTLEVRVYDAASMKWAIERMQAAARDIQNKYPGTPAGLFGNKELGVPQR